MKSQILNATARFICAFQIMLSVYFLLRGHNLPGGGFIGGLVAASAFTVYEIGVGERMAIFGLRISPITLMMTGLACAITAGVWGFVIRGVVFQSVWGPELNLPLVGSLKLGSAMLFDLGVYLLVGSMMTELAYAIGEEALWKS